MKARPILFSAPMILALLAGRKTQTRRICKPQPRSVGDEFSTRQHGTLMIRGTDEDSWKPVPCPYGAAGDMLWARETWQHAPQRFCSCPQASEPSPCDDWSEGIGCKSNRGEVVYAADGASLARWRPSIFMPRWASRITLRLTDVRAERLQDISEADAIWEGIEHNAALDPVGPCKWRVYTQPDTGTDRPEHSYGTLWESINGSKSWARNDWVWRIVFEVIKANVDAVMREAA